MVCPNYRPWLAAGEDVDQTPMPLFVLCRSFCVVCCFSCITMQKLTTGGVARPGARDHNALLPVTTEIR